MIPTHWKPQHSASDCFWFPSPSTPNITFLHYLPITQPSWSVNIWSPKNQAPWGIWGEKEFPALRYTLLQGTTLVKCESPAHGLVQEERWRQVSRVNMGPKFSSANLHERAGKGRGNFQSCSFLFLCSSGRRRRGTSPQQPGLQQRGKVDQVFCSAWGVLDKQNQSHSSVQVCLLLYPHPREGQPHIWEPNVTDVGGKSGNGLFLPWLLTGAFIGVSAMWILWCLIRYDLWMKLFPQLVHL